MYPVLTRLEMVTLLCVSDKPHSQLTELMPERCGTGQLRDFDAILAQVICISNAQTNAALRSCKRIAN